jgi:PEP-CTERM motif
VGGIIQESRTALSRYTRAASSESATTDAVRIYGGNSDDNFCFDNSCGQGGYAVGQVEVFGSPAVPEPSTWAMMLLGFAGLGFAGYRRTRKPA